MMGVIFFVMNAIFALVLLILVLASSTYALVSKNPDVRYQPMRDDRGSFIKSSSNMMNTELDALGATARGEMKTRDLDDESFVDRAYGDAGSVPLPPSTSGSMRPPSSHSTGMPRSPVDPAVPLFPSVSNDNRSQHNLSPDSGRPPYDYNTQSGGYQNQQGGGYPQQHQQQNNQPMQWNVGVGYEGR